MWKTISGYLLSFVGSYWTVIFNVLTYGAALFAGAYGMYLYYDNKIQEIETAQIKVVAEMKEKTIAQLEQREKETAKIISERDDEKSKHDDDIKRLNAIIARMQYGGNSNSGKLSANGSNSPKSTEELQQRGRELQERCGKLLVRGADIVGRISADKDAIVKLTTQGTKEAK